MRTERNAVLSCLAPLAALLALSPASAAAFAMRASLRAQALVSGEITQFTYE
jgi:hypothetical protein